LDGIHKLHKDPNLDHVAGFPVVGLGGKARRDDNAMGVLVENVAVAQRTPPRLSMRATRTITSAKARMARGPWYLLGIFMVF
jgi:hypothetical protein